MGYSTYFRGQFLLDRPLTVEHKRILDEFNEADHRDDIGMPGIWCGWRPSEDGTAIVHDGGEKFYDYIEWMQYLCDHFLTPWGYMVAGIVEWEGEENTDMGRMVISSPNKVTAQYAVITYR